MTPLSVLIAVTHLLGVGHLVRAAAIARGLAQAGHRVTLVSGGRPAPLIDTAGLDFVQLPPVHCRDADFRTLLDDTGQPLSDALRAARIAVLRAAAVHARPDVVITETFPFGRRQLAAEFIALLEWADAQRPRPAILSSVRDILNPPSRPGRATEADARLERFYDAVLVHGAAEITPLSASWPVSPALERRLVYTGYVTENRAPSSGAPGPPDIMVSGGGSAASLPLFRAAIAASRLLTERRWRLLVGHGIEPDAFARLAAAAHRGLVVERARADFRDLLAGCAVSVSQAGYNTVVDLAEAGVRAIVVPFSAGQEVEQRLRAAELAKAGLAQVIDEAALSPDRLAGAVRAAIAGPAPPARRFDLDGVAGSVRAIETAAATARDLGKAWAALEEQLDAAAAGQEITVWWRDDDAVAPSPALDRLLDLASRFGVPLALAVIPDLATPELAARLAGTDVAVLVHGFRHANHAPPPAKKQELGYRPAELLHDELRCALDSIKARFGPLALPVLVPPWNRIDPALLPHLSTLGFRGLSAFGTGALDTQIDPVDWHNGRGLRNESELVSHIRRLVDMRLKQGKVVNPIGLVTHHDMMDEGTWRFVERLLSLFRDHRAVRFGGIAALLPKP